MPWQKGDIGGDIASPSYWPTGPPASSLRPGSPLPPRFRFLQRLYQISRRRVRPATPAMAVWLYGCIRMWAHTAYMDTGNMRIPKVPTYLRAECQEAATAVQSSESETRGALGRGNQRRPQIAAIIINCTRDDAAPACRPRRSPAGERFPASSPLIIVPARPSSVSLAAACFASLPALLCSMCMHPGYLPWPDRVERRRTMEASR